MVSRISIMSVPVTDQDRSLRFYRDVLGFAVLVDQRVSDTMRWVQLAPPGGGTTITLTTWFPDLRPGTLTGTVLSVDDLDSAIEEHRARGLTIEEPISQAPWGRWVGFHDPDGNRWTLQQDASPAPTGTR